MAGLGEVFRSKFLRNAGAMSAGAAVVQGIAFLSSLILTRLYGPHEFGVLAIFLAFLTFAATISSLHYEMAIALPREPERGASVTLLALLISIITAIISVIVFAPWAGNLGGRMGYTELDRIWWLLPLAIIGSAFQQTLTLWHARCGRFSTVAQNGVIQSLAQNTLQILFGFAKLGATGLVLGLGISRLLAGLVLLRRRFDEDREVFAKGLLLLKSVLGDFRAFPLVGLWGAILHVTCFQIPALLLGEFYESSVAGFYLLQDRVLSVPLTVLGQGVASVFYVNAAKLAREDPLGLRESYFKILRNLVLVGILPTLALIAFGPWLFRTVFGQNWETAGVYARIFALSTFLRFVAGPLFRCLTILNKQWWIFIFDAIGLMFMLSATSYLTVRGYSAVWAVSAISVGLVLAYSGLLISASIAVIRHSRLDTSIKAVSTVAPV